MISEAAEAAARLRTVSACRRAFARASAATAASPRAAWRSVSEKRRGRRVAAEERPEEGRALPGPHGEVLETHADEGPRAEPGGECRGHRRVVAGVLHDQQRVGPGELEVPDRELTRAHADGAFQERPPLRVVLRRVDRGDDPGLHVVCVAGGTIGPERRAGRGRDALENRREVGGVAEARGRGPDDLLGAPSGRPAPRRHARLSTDGLCSAYRPPGLQTDPTGSVFAGPADGEEGNSESHVDLSGRRSSSE